MGSGFDLFDERSHFAADGISREALEHRTVLRAAMIEAGFEPYPQEWWHFSYPVPETAKRLDFALEPCG
jgi:D-alanyl-D-alanine dipeptidase